MKTCVTKCVIAAYLLALCILLLWPLDFYLPVYQKSNSVEWISETNGVLIPASGIIHLPRVPEMVHDALVSGTGFTAELWLSADNDFQDGPARIVSYSANPAFRNFTIGQESRDLVVRLRTPTTDLNARFPSLIATDVFQSRTVQHVVVTYNFSEQRVYVDGRIHSYASIPGGTFANWDPSYPLSLGNEATGNRPWLGRVFLVAIYNRPLFEQEVVQNYLAGRVIDQGFKFNERVSSNSLLLYTFAEGSGRVVFNKVGRVPAADLRIPEKLTMNVSKSGVFAGPRVEFGESPVNFRQVAEIVGNVVIFIPLGFIVHRRMNGHYQSTLKLSLLILVIGALFSGFIETMQFFIESRYSSMTDLIANMFGVGVGACVGYSRPIPPVYQPDCET